MRRFEARDFTASSSNAGIRLIGENGITATVPSALFRLSFATTAPDGDLEADLEYRPVDDAQRTCRIALAVNVRRHRASAVFFLPEPARELALRCSAGPVPEVTGPVRLRRLSTFLAETGATATALLRRLGKPAEMGALVAALREGGSRGLVKSLHQVARQDLDRQIRMRYRELARRRDATLRAERARLAKEATLGPDRPLMRIVLQAGAVDPELLRGTIDSVIDQIWNHWELFAVVDSPQSVTARLIREWCHAESRINLVDVRQTDWSFLVDGIDEPVRCCWVTILQPQDRLAADALLEVATAIRNNPDAGVVYTDEDCFDAEGGAFDPSFKPDWNLELFLSWNLIGNLGCFRADLVSAVGGMTPEDLTEGGVYDLSLRITERLEPAGIIHVPRVLYHRAASRPNRRGGDVGQSELRSLHEFLHRNGIAARAVGDNGSWRASYSLPEPIPLVSIVIPTRDRLSLLEKCVESIRARTDYPNYEIIVVDNGSRRRETLEWLAHMEEQGIIRLLRDDAPFNYAALNNAAVAAARGQVLALLNNDVEVIGSRWLTEMVSVCLQPGVGAVGAKLYYPDGTIQHAGILLNPETVASHWFAGYSADFAGPDGRLRMRQRVSAVTGACLVTPRNVYKELGGLDADHLTVAYNDVDYCLRVGEAGMRVVFTPYAELVHHESASRGSDAMPAKSSRLYAELAFMKKRWRETLERDPWGMPGLPRHLGSGGWANLAG